MWAGIVGRGMWFTMSAFKGLCFKESFPSNYLALSLFILHKASAIAKTFRSQLSFACATLAGYLLRDVSFSIPLTKCIDVKLPCTNKRYHLELMGFIHQMALLDDLAIDRYATEGEFNFFFEMFVFLPFASCLWSDFDCYGATLVLLRLMQGALVLV